MEMKPIDFKDDKLILIDQRKLPKNEDYFICKDYKDVIYAIKEMVVRGAPAIGVTAAYGIAIYVLKETSKESLIKNFDKVCNELANTRPTAVNLFWAINRMKKRFYMLKNEKLDVIKDKLLKEAHIIFKEDIEINKKIGENGNKLIKDNSNILTHCNAGALATAGYGTALGVIRSAYYSGKKIHVFVDETRPFLQGSRLTAWELMKENIPCTLICDNMAGFLMKLGKIDAVIVGADRIAANGDTANKIGTYTLAVLAKKHNIPFYVAAPYSTFDFSIKNGNEIPIEERPGIEITNLYTKDSSPNGVKTFNPAFDVTDAELISAIITEKDILYPPLK